MNSIAKTYKLSMKLYTKDCDVKGVWRPSYMMEAFQEAANIHCEMLGTGRDDLLATGRTWVLARYGIDIKRWPKIGDTITIETIPLPCHRFIFPRMSKVYDETGDEIIRALGAYSILNIASRRVELNPADIIARVPDNSDLGLSNELPESLGEMEGQPLMSIYHTVYTDLDFNGHMNNVKYLDVLCNTLGTQVMKEYEIARLVINYKKEVHPETDITLQLVRQGDEFMLTGIEEGQIAFKLGGALRKTGSGSNT